MKTKSELIGHKFWAKFPSVNKQHTLIENDESISESSNDVLCVIKKHIILTQKEWDKVTNSFLDDRVNMWEKIGGSESIDKRLEGYNWHEMLADERLKKIWHDTSYVNVVMVNTSKMRYPKPFNGTISWDPVYVNTEGHNYARYVGRRSTNREIINLKERK